MSDLILLRVRSLHAPDESEFCPACGDYSPCPTILALDGLCPCGHEPHRDRCAESGGIGRCQCTRPYGVTT